MPKIINVNDARALLLSRSRLLDRGLGERGVRDLVTAGALRRVRRGRYVYADDWATLWNEGRHLVEVVALQANSDGAGPVYWGPSAAVLHGLPLYRTRPTAVHVAVEDARHGRLQSGVARHRTELPASEIVEIDGIRCTSLDRTVMDLARTATSEAAISAADAALRREAVTGHRQDEDMAAAWRDRLMVRARSSHSRGVRRARGILSFADGRAQLPGESVSRWFLRTLGFRRYDLQAHVRGPDGEDYFLDFAFLGAEAFGEFDGRGKYLEDELTRGRSAAEVVFKEKQREDAVRGVTGWRTVRWGSSHIESVDRFAARLSAFGIRPPG